MRPTNRQFLQTLTCDRFLRVVPGSHFAPALRLAFDHVYRCPSRTSAGSVHSHPLRACTERETNDTLRPFYELAARFQKGCPAQEPAVFLREASRRLPDERTLSESPEPSQPPW